jgi:hypothetical protein
MAGTITEAQQIDCAQIMGVTLETVIQQIAYLGDLFTTQVATDVGVELTRWGTAGVDFVRVHPRERNFGAEINPEDTKDDIRGNLASLFQRMDWAQASSGSTMTIGRG